MVRRWYINERGMLTSEPNEYSTTPYVLHYDYAELEAESLEQARLLGMSAEREIALRAKADRMADALEEAVDTLHPGYSRGRKARKKCYEALSDYRGE